MEELGKILCPLLENSIAHPCTRCTYHLSPLGAFHQEFPMVQLTLHKQETEEFCDACFNDYFGAHKV